MSFKFSLRLAMAITLATITSFGNAQWTNGQDAVFVVGQVNFTTYVATVSSTGLSNPESVAIDAPRGKMYVSDRTAHRVLRYAWPVTANTPAAELVFGQPTFTTSTVNNGGISASSLSDPRQVAVDSNGTLAVSDRGNNRVLLFPNAHALSTNAPAASKVFGQPNFTSSAFAQTSSGLRGNASVTFDSTGTLYIVDMDQHRVLRHENPLAKANGAAADGVLGQTDFVTATTGLSASKFNSPRDAVAIGSSLYIAESNNHRVLRFDNAATKSNGANADAVLLQPDFTTNASSTTVALGYQGHGLGFDNAGRLYVAERGNNRITIFNNANSLGSGAPANFVLGQSNFTTNTGLRTIRNLATPLDVSVDNDAGFVAVADEASGRVMIFQASTPLPVGLSEFAVE